MCSYVINLSNKNIVAILTNDDADADADATAAAADDNNNTLMGFSGHPTTITITLKGSRCHHFGQHYDIYIYIYTRLFVSPSRTSELDCATTETDMTERSISIGRESLKVFLFCNRGLGVLAGSIARG